MDKLGGYDWRGMLKKAQDKVKQYTLNLTDLELKVEDATSNETWGPHGSTMTEISEAAFDYESYRQIMGVLARRLQEKDENWRMCYKALLLLEFLVKHGPMKVVQDIAGSAQVLDRLTNFEYRDANGKDHGVNVRHRAKELLALVNSPDRVREERAKAKANKAKYSGVSASEMRATSFGGGSSRGFGSTGPSTQRMYGGGGSSGFGSSGGGFGGSSLGGGGGSSFSRGGRMSQEDAEEDFHYISKRATASEGSEQPDAVSATRARIEAMKLSSRGEGADERTGAEGEQHRKKLTDVKVNPKIAASLGLKIPAPGPAAARPAAPAAPAPIAGAEQASLLGGAAAPATAPATASATDFFDALSAPAPAAPAAAPALAAGGWDAFGGSSAPAAPAAPAAAGGWDAFGSSSPAAPAAAPVDLFVGVAAPAPAVGASPPAAAAPAFDPFATAGAAPAPTPASVADLADPFALPAPVAAASAPAVAPAAASALAAPVAKQAQPAKASSGPLVAGAPLPEDMFSDLTGIGHRNLAPMGSGRGLHMEPAPLSATSPTAAVSPGVGGAFAGAPGAVPVGAAPLGPIVRDPRTGQPVMLVPVPVGPGAAGVGGMPGVGLQQPPQQQQQAPADLSGLIGAPAGGAGAQQGGGFTGGKDPFADLFK